ncbi:FRG domain-containing protein [Ewingella americana]|uniref:FRG domain-containing protein n=1 Tax=Ewingella americana (strain ATCC 33852 / DSM 4580 / CCUG 14506 / JCM 5911 / LMG 7869 / NCTC 12157 / CDC 1468-78) TaxID=910964 RepID=A0A085GQ41_EWIA3|nr:FRG domain-containing protein [Ewingella americana]KAA8727992.1 FRG domain-containing protein [Ewingella americana]KFC85836.1 hypothetical protein GEAM_0312 [Ewingella americana ATCC 33852]
MRAVKKIEKITSVSGFIENIMNINKRNARPTAFRGQKFYDWDTEPKIFRDDCNVYSEENLIVRDLVSVHPQEFDSDKTMFDRLVRMQHFGLPTRLLDVTLNPLVALWFASEKYLVDGKEQDGKVQYFLVPKERQKYYDSDRVSCMANLANLKSESKEEIFKLVAQGLSRAQFNRRKCVDELFYNIGFEKPNFRKIIEPMDLIRPVFVKPKLNNKRIIAQSGAFLIYGAKTYKGASGEAIIPVRRIMVSANAKENIREELELLGIHASSLFPEIDKASEFIVKKYNTSSDDSSFLI